MCMCVLMSTFTITLYMNLAGVDDEASHSNDILLEAKDEHKGDKVQIFLEGEFYKYMYIL